MSKIAGDINVEMMHPKVIYESRKTLFAEMVRKTGSKQSVLDRMMQEIEELTKERDHWKANHDTRVEAARLLIDRTDMPLERVKAYKRYMELAAQNEGMREAIELYFKQYPHMMKGYILDALNLPNLATEFLKRRDAATLRRAAEHFDKAIGLVAGDGKETLTAIELRRMAAEIEKET